MPPAQTRSAFARGRTAYIFPDHAWFKHDLFGKPFHRFPDHAFRPPRTGVAMAAIDPITAGAVFIATAATDAVYVMFTSAVVARKRVPAATWSSIWYLLSSYAVISYT
ncbi:hypothetical protein chiPu_0033034, partial [Chiloscyllium punctatum]|nr:hypothetical protein [Chiloscyllium punctatum]